MRGYLLFLAMVTTALLLSTAGASADTRGLTIKLKASEAKDAPVTEEVRLYGSSHALVIGIDAYTGGWPRLRKAVEDARAVAEDLRGKRFEVTLKTNLKAEALRATLREFFAIKGADPNARLMLWFAGHGHTINGEGFLVPADAPAATEPTFLVNASTYYVFKGLGGAADGNKDRQLSLNELAAFVGREVKTQASRLGWEQTPQLTGDGNRVLAKW